MDSRLHVFFVVDLFVCFFRFLSFSFCFILLHSSKFTPLFVVLFVCFLICYL